MCYQQLIYDDCFLNFEVDSIKNQATVGSLPKSHKNEVKKVLLHTAENISLEMRSALLII